MAKRKKAKTKKAKVEKDQGQDWVFSEGEFQDEGYQDDASEGLPKWGDVLRKVVSVGVGAAFMTEESVRNALGGVHLPKEVLATALQGATRSKEEFLSKLGTETMKLISKIDFVKEASRFMEDHKFKIQAEIEIVKKTPPEA